MPRRSTWSVHSCRPRSLHAATNASGGNSRCPQNATHFFVLSCSPRLAHDSLYLSCAAITLSQPPTHMLSSTYENPSTPFADSHTSTSHGCSSMQKMAPPASQP